MKLRTMLLAGAAATTLISSGGAVYAQTAAPATAADNGIGNVIITARKKSENLQRVPVAVTAQTGKQLGQQGIRVTTDLGRVVPSLIVAVSGSEPSSAVFVLRGQSAGDILLTLSQPVGFYEDSVNIPHPVGLQGSFFDVQRVEVLKGPQGTLYGRNTTGGAINLITNGADYSGVHGFVNLEGGDYSDWKIGGAVNVPVVPDVLAVRIAYQHWNRAGVGKSLLTGQSLGDDHDDDIVRFSARFDPTPNVESISKFEFSNIDSNGAAIKLFEDAGTNPAVAASQLGGLLPVEAALENYTKFGLAPSGACAALTGPALFGCGLGLLAPITNNKNIFQNYDKFNSSKTTVYHAVEDVTWNITDALKLRSITGWHQTVDNVVEDLDGTPYTGLYVGDRAPLLAGFGLGQPGFISSIPPEGAYNSYTQEVNLSGHAFGRLDWLVGGFGSWETGSGAEPQQFAPFTLASAGQIAGYSNTTDSYGYSTQTWAVYTQDDIHITNQATLTLGARYTEESQVNRAQGWAFDPFPYFDSTTMILHPANTYYCQANNEPPPDMSNNPTHCPIIPGGSEHANGISYLASFNYQITPQMMAYIKTSRGFRGGALQFRDPFGPPVKPEIATDYEIGFKGDFLDHRLRTNLAAYLTEYANKQETAIITGPLGLTTILVNAAQAQIEGFEAEVTAVPVDNWSIYGSLTYLYGEYLSYRNPLNVDGTFVAGGNCANFPAGDTQPGLPAACILHNFSFADPHWKYSIGSRYEYPVGPGKLGGQLDWSWTSGTPQTILSHSTIVAQWIQNENSSAIGYLNGRLDYTLPDQKLTLALFVTNLLDQHHYSIDLYAGEVGMTTVVPSDPRMFGVTITKSFGAGE